MTKKREPVPEVMNKTQAREYLQVDEATMDRLCREQQIPHRKLGTKTYRFSRAALETWLANAPMQKEGA